MSQSTRRVRVRSLALCVVMACGAAVNAQNQTPRPTPRSVGHQGVSARMPGMPNRPMTLPIHRQYPRTGGQTSVPATAVTPHAVPGRLGDTLVYRHGDYHRTGGGLHVDGAYDGDDWKLRIHLGGGGLVRLPDGTVYYPHGGLSHGYYRRGGVVYYNPGWYYDTGRYWSSRWSSRPVDGVLTQYVDPSLLTRPQPPAPQPPSEPERELTPLETARLLMRADEAEDAIDAFRDHLEQDPEDVRAMRAMAVAMLEAGRLSDGVSLLALAYRTDAMLARTPLDLEELGLDQHRRFDRLLGRVLGYAKRTDAASAHLAGVALLQGDRKASGALRVLDRAAEAGLREDIADAFRRELGVVAGG